MEDKNLGSPKSRFLDNQDGTITDNETGLCWCQKDSFQIYQDWLTFQEAISWVDEINKKDFLGFHDWRIPEKDEIEKLFLSDNIIIGRSNQELQDRKSTRLFLNQVAEMVLGVCHLINKRHFTFHIPVVFPNSLTRISRKGT